MAEYSPRNADFSTTSSLVDELKVLSPIRWESFVLLYSPMLKFWLHRECVPSASIDDLLQESFRSIYAGIGNFQRNPSDGSFRGWMRSIVRRRVADYRRLEHKSVSTQDYAIEILAVPPVNEDDSENEVLSEVIARACQVVRQNVQPHTWQMFQMCVLESQPAEDVARILGVSSANVRMAKARILKQLRELLVDFE